MKSLRYSQKNMPFTVGFFLLIPGMWQRETLFHFTVNTINPEMTSQYTAMIDLNLNELIFRVFIQTQIKQQNYPVTLITFGVATQIAYTVLYFQYPRFGGKRRIRADVYQILKVCTSPLLLLTFTHGFISKEFHPFLPPSPRSISYFK